MGRREIRVPPGHDIYVEGTPDGRLIELGRDGGLSPGSYRGDVKRWKKGSWAGLGWKRRGDGLAAREGQRLRKEEGRPKCTKLALCILFI